MKYLISLFTLFCFSSQAGLPPTSLSGQSAATPTTTFNFKTPYSQATQILGANSLIETGSENMLINPGFEAAALGSAWVNASGVASVTSTVGEFSSGLQAAKVALTAQALSFSQSVVTTSGMQTQFTIGILYKVPSAITDFQICPLIAGVETNCVPSTSLIADNLYHQIEIPVVITPGSTVGIKAKTTATYTQNVFIDAAYVKQGLGFQNLQGDTVYSATISAAGASSNLNKAGWITSCTVASPSVCTLGAGIVTQNLNCTANFNNGVQRGLNISATSTTTISLQEYLPSTNASIALDSPFNIICQKSGNDYLASSSNVYTQSSANTNPAIYSPTYTGGASFADEGVYWWRDGKFLTVRGTSVITTPSAAAFSISLPSGLAIDASSMSSTTNSNAVGTYLDMSGTVANAFPTIARGPFIIFSDTAVSSSVVYISNATNGSRFDKSAGNIISGTGNRFRFEFRIPIAGWSNSNVIVGSFAGVLAVPGYQGNVDTFSFCFGGASCAASCTTGTCFLSSTSPTLPSSVAFASTGTYTMSFPKTYSKMFCSGVGLNAGTARTQLDPMFCTSCSSMTITSTTTTVANTTASVTCTGTY